MDIHAKTEPLKDEITIRSKSKTSTIKASSFHGGFSARTADAKRIFNDASVEMRKVLEITDCSNQITAISERGLNKSCYLKGNLEKVSFPGLIKVFSEAFSDRKYLTCVNAPNITTIEKKGFKNCSRLG